MRAHLIALSAAAVIVASGTSGAVADHLVTGADVKDGSLQYKDLSSVARGKLKNEAGPSPLSMFVNEGAAPASRNAKADRRHPPFEESSARTIALPDGTKLTATCRAYAVETEASRDATLKIGASTYTDVLGRVDATYSDTDPGPTTTTTVGIADASDQQVVTYQQGESAVGFSTTGATVLRVSSSQAGNIGSNNKPPATTGSFSVLVHNGSTTTSLNLWMYVDASQCEINVQAVPSTDSGRLTTS